MQTSTDGARAIPSAPSAIRRRVLAAWAASPARFREDANAEEDLVRGGYRDRLLVELAQNAADAAVRAGVPGRLRLELAGRTMLRAANTGAPLDAARRPGAGHAARLGQAGRGRAASAGSASASPRCWRSATSRRCVSATGGVRFSADAHPGRGRRAVPRSPTRWPAGTARCRCCGCPWPAEGTPPDGLRHRGGAAAAGRRPRRPSRGALGTAAGRAAAGAARPGGDRGRGRRPDAAACASSGRRRRVRLTDGDRDDGAGQVAPAVRGARPPSSLADRPVEERDRRAWTVTWAVPLDDDGRPRPLPGRAGRARADAERRAAVAARAADRALPARPRPAARGPGPGHRRAGRGGGRRRVADLVAGAAGRSRRCWRWSRGSGWPARSSTPALGAAVLDRLRTTAWLPVRRRGGRPAVARPRRRARRRDRRARRRAAPASLPGLLPADWSRRSDGPALTALGVRRVGHGRGGRGGPRGGAAGVLVGRGCTPRSTAPTARSSPPCRCRSPTGAPRTARPGCCCPTPGCRSHRLAALGLRLAEPEAVATPGRAAAAGAARRPAGHGRAPSSPTRPCGPPSRPRWTPSRTPSTAPRSGGAGRGGARPGRGGAAGGRGAALAGRARAARRRRRLGAGGGAGAAGLAAGRRARPTARSGCWTPGFAATADPDALRAVGVLDTFAARARRATPTTSTSTARTEWVDAVLDRLPGRRAAAGVAAADRRPRPGTGRRLAARRCRCWPRCRPRRGPTSSLGGVPVPELPALVAVDPPRARRQAAGPAAAPGRARSCRDCTNRRDADPAVLALLRPPATARRRPGRRRTARSTCSTGSATPPGPCGRTCCAPSTRGWPRRWTASTSTRRSGCGSAPDRVVADAVVLDAPYLQPLVDPPVVPAGGAPGRGRRPARPAAGRRAGPGDGHRAGRPVAAPLGASCPGAGAGGRPAGRRRADRRGGRPRARSPSDGRAVAWWPGEDVDHVDGSPAALGRALAWRAGAWSLRQALAEAFAHPDRAARAGRRGRGRLSSRLTGPSAGWRRPGRGRASTGGRRAGRPAARTPGARCDGAPAPYSESHCAAGERRRPGGRRQALLAQPADAGGAGQLGAEQRDRAVRRPRRGRRAASRSKAARVGLGQRGAGRRRRPSGRGRDMGYLRTRCGAGHAGVRRGGQATDGAREDAGADGGPAECPRAISGAQAHGVPHGEDGRKAAGRVVERFSRSAALRRLPGLVGLPAGAVALAGVLAALPLLLRAAGAVELALLERGVPVPVARDGGDDHGGSPRGCTRKAAMIGSRIGEGQHGPAAQTTAPSADPAQRRSAEARYPSSRRPSRAQYPPSAGGDPTQWSLGRAGSSQPLATTVFGPYGRGSGSTVSRLASAVAYRIAPRRLLTGPAFRLRGTP